MSLIPYIVTKDIDFSAELEFVSNSTSRIRIIKGALVYFDDSSINQLHIPLSGNVFIIKPVQDRIFKEYFKEMQVATFEEKVQTKKTNKLSFINKK
jgi:hypothetical protein